MLFFLLHWGCRIGDKLSILISRLSFPASAEQRAKFEAREYVGLGVNDNLVEGN
jgi:hypothetical protein